MHGDSFNLYIFYLYMQSLICKSFASVFAPFVNSCIVMCCAQVFGVNVRVVAVSVFALLLALIFIK